MMSATDLNNTTMMHSKNEIQVIDDFSRVDIDNESVTSRPINLPLYETNEEQELLKDLETRQIFHMRENLKAYIRKV